MAKENETISVAEFASLLGLDPQSTKDQVLGRLAAVMSSPAGVPHKRWKLSKKFKNHAEFEALSREEVRVQVIASQPIAERGQVYYPEELDTKGKIKKPADVFITDRARLLKIAWAVKEVPSNTPTTEELRAREKKEKAAN